MNIRNEPDWTSAVTLKQKELELRKELANIQERLKENARQGKELSEDEWNRIHAIRESWVEQGRERKKLRDAYEGREPSDYHAARTAAFPDESKEECSALIRWFEHSREARALVKGKGLAVIACCRDVRQALDRAEAEKVATPKAPGTFPENVPGETEAPASTVADAPEVRDAKAAARGTRKVAQEDAKAILAEARKEAKRIVREAKKEAKKLRDEFDKAVRAEARKLNKSRDEHYRQRESALERREAAVYNHFFQQSGKHVDKCVVYIVPVDENRRLISRLHPDRFANGGAESVTEALAILNTTKLQ